MYHGTHDQHAAGPQVPAGAGAPGHAPLAFPQPQQATPAPQHQPAVVMGGGAPAQPYPQHAPQHAAQQPAVYPQHAVPAHQLHPAVAQQLAHQQAMIAGATHPAVAARQGGSFAYPAAGGMRVLPSPGQRVVGERIRLRWENILPALTVVCLVIAIGLFAKDYDEILGTPGSAANQQSAATAETGSAAGTTTGTTQARITTPAATPRNVEAELARARRLMKAGHYQEAGLIVRPLKGTSRQATALAAQLDRTEAHNARLLNQLGAQQARGNWAGVVRTLHQIKRLHPLSTSQRALLTRASANAAAARRQQAAATQHRQQAHPAPPGASGGGGGAPPSSGSGPPAQSGQPPKPPSGSSGTPGNVGNMNGMDMSGMVM